MDYPRDMSMFAGVGYNIDAVFQWKNGQLIYLLNVHSSQPKVRFDKNLEYFPVE